MPRAVGELLKQFDARGYTRGAVTERPQTCNVPRVAKWASASISRGQTFPELT
jgi:hypothetical protein